MSTRRVGRTVLRILAITLTAGLAFGAASATADSPDQSSPYWDMWDPGWMHRGMWGPGHMGSGMRQRVFRHWTFMHQGIPTEYRGARNTLPFDAETIAVGRALYQANCASCHGATGMGDGEAGRALNPSPALLAYMIQTPMAVDEYLLWTVSEGGVPFGTAMPAFKDTLSKDEIWKIVVYLRAGLPAD